MLRNAGPSADDRRWEEGGSMIGRLIYASGQKIVSKANAPEKRKQISNIE